MEFDNRVTNQKEPNFKYPKIEYNRQFNAKTSNQPIRDRKSITQAGDAQRAHSKGGNGTK